MAKRVIRITGRLSWLWAVLLGTAALLLWCGVRVGAAGFQTAIDLGSVDGTLTIRYDYGTEADDSKNLALVDAKFTVYRVADVSAEGVYSLTDDFQGCGVTDETLNHLEYASEEKEAAEILSSYVAGRKISESWTATTDQNGEAVLSGLAVGLYLVTCEDLVTETAIYSGSPALISVPTADSENLVWNYEVTVNVKPERTEIETGTETEPETPDSETTGEEETPDTVQTPLTGTTAQTGDTAPLGALIAFVVICGATLVILLLYRRRNRGGE